MERGTELRNTVVELEEEFRRVREPTIAEYDRELQRFREEEAVMADRSRRYSEDMRRILEENGVEAEQLFQSLKRTWAGQEDELQGYLAETRPALLEAEPDPDEWAREGAGRSLLVAGFDWSEAHLIGADLLAPDAESLGGVEGDIGNPGTWLYPPGALKTKLKDVSSGSGSGCVGRAVPVPVKAIWWYSWKPPQKGTYAFWAGTSWRGFYFITADDGCFSCKSASLSARASIRVHQHWWRGESAISIAQQGGQHLHKSLLLDGSTTWKSYEYLDTSAVLVKAEVSLLARAKGSGSYAEINFKDGKGAFVAAPAIMVSKHS